MKRFLLFFFFSYCHGAVLFAQNVGIGTTTPLYPLSFQNVLGNKIGLWGTGTNHYGLGVQSGLLQLYSDVPLSNIAFGHGASASFTERMRIINSGGDGMQLNGRLIIRNGSSPLNLSDGPGIWLTRPDNTSLGSFIGVQNNSNIGFFGAGSGWGLVFNADNGRVGIGTSMPVNRLDVAGLNNWDLTNTEGDMRIGNINHRLKFGVALSGGGAGASSIMQSGGVGTLTLGANSRNLLQLNGGNNSLNLINLTGGLRVNDNAGVAGQVLKSNGTAAPPSWQSRPYTLKFTTLGNSLLVATPTKSTPIIGLDDQTFVLTEAATVQITISARMFAWAATGTATGSIYVDIRNTATNGVIITVSASGHAKAFDGVTLLNTDVVSLPAGTYLLKATHRRHDEVLSGDSYQVDHRVILQISPN